MVSGDSHDRVNRLREKMGFKAVPSIPLTETDIKVMEARTKRQEEAGYVEDYVRLFNRDYWTDQWLGEGSEPPMPYLDLSKKEQKALKKQEEKEWRKKYLKEVDTIHLSADSQEKKILKTIQSAQIDTNKKSSDESKEVISEAEYEKRKKIARYFLYDCLRPEFREDFTRPFINRPIEDLVNYLYEYYESWMLMRDRVSYGFLSDGCPGYVEKRMREEQEQRKTVMTVGNLKFQRVEDVYAEKKYIDIPPPTAGLPDIPDSLWKEFKKWCKSHPLKDFKKKAQKYSLQYGYMFYAQYLRRVKFIKKVNKRNKKFHKRMMLYDPQTGMSFLSKKKMLQYIEDRLYKVDQKTAEFQKILYELVDAGMITDTEEEDWYLRSQTGRKELIRLYRDLKQRSKKDYEKQEDEEKRQFKKLKYIRDQWCAKYGHIKGKVKPVEYVIDGIKATCMKLEKDMSDDFCYHIISDVGNVRADSYSDFVNFKF